MVGLKVYYKHSDGGAVMTKMGRPKMDDPIERKVTVKFKNSEYEILVEYAKSHDLSVSQVLRLGFENLLNQTKVDS